MKTLVLESDQIGLILESLDELKYDLYARQRKELINLEVKKTINQEEYDAFERFVNQKVSEITKTKESISNQLKENR